MKMEGLSFPEAVMFLAKRVGVTIEERSLTPAEQERQGERDLLFRVTELAARYYRRVLQEEPAGEAGRVYLARRGWTQRLRGLPARLRPGRLGGAGPLAGEPEGAAGAGGEVGVDPEEVGGSGFYDLLRNRLIFPSPMSRDVRWGLAAGCWTTLCQVPELARVPHLPQG